MREVLLAMSWDTALTHLDPDKKIDITARSAANVVTVRPRNTYLRTPNCAAADDGRGSQFRSRDRRRSSASLRGPVAPCEPPASESIHDTQSRVRVAFSRTNRDVYLEKGQAIFKVKDDAARPFRVRVDRAVIQAIGTQFDVYRRADRLDVAVIEGRVQVSSERPAGAESGAAALERAQIAAGESVSVIEGRITVPAPIDATEASAMAATAADLPRKPAGGGCLGIQSVQPHAADSTGGRALADT